jgi:hypothetical protein
MGCGGSSKAKTPIRINQDDKEQAELLMTRDEIRRYQKRLESGLNN